MSLDADTVLTGLLTQNYFPNQKEKKDELPPIFSSVTFTKDIANSIRLLNNSKPRNNGYDQVDIRFTRYNNLFRLMNIPHPKAYSHLCFHIHEYWDKLSITTKNYSSIIRPKAHKDGRVIIMDYESFDVRRHRVLNKSFGKRFLVRTDIAGFFSSIYSHSIPWAAVGMQQAKVSRGKEQWFNKFDEYVQINKRRETNGIAIGPGSSNIIAEYILNKIDMYLAKDKKYTFIRFIDDYQCFCSTHEEAEQFITDLSEKLLDYKLSLNLRKTDILTLPVSHSGSWVSDLQTRVPKGKQVSLYEALNFIDYAIDLHKKVPDGSVLKFALNSVAKRIERKRMSIIRFKKKLLDLSFHYPILLPSFRHVADESPSKYFVSSTAEELNKLIMESSKNKRSDAMVWSLYFLQKQGLNPSQDVVDAIIKTRDCLAVTALLNNPLNNDKVKDFINEVKDYQDDFILDNYWILLYEAFKRNLIRNPYKNDQTFKLLKDANVNFLMSHEASL